ncbi:ferrous iron transport protein B [Porcipelethomonas ammoniilytica]|uniref:ferrous iron transport protein B n=1 Tax=Porcipelethomonas ammoniilytica TaxID=2981722 RepID=UPI0008212521|nr:ferrous iron transport protein B [Porcipelethomonas ammoniilytica]MCU6719080.1 ferrous iron transport protein B [Porcipelethomonas ammoniilytica]SCI68752.1 Ferrous iron transport protein B [uncultured Ruminococcus sp.]
MEIKIALAGNPNCGKTTLFNALTGANQFVGNWPGVTVEKKEGKLKGHKDIVITDLPGIYSLSPYTLEEVVARNYLIGERPDAILNIIDGTNLERNLYLTTQLVELGIPVVIAVNMMDIVRKNGDKINIAQLSKELGCAVCEISALKGTGIKEAAEKAVAAAKAKESTVPQHSFCGCVEHAIAHIEEAFLHNVPEEQQRWYAIKIFERDDKVLEQLSIPEDVKNHIEEDIASAEKEMDDDAESIITNERYIYISSIIKGCYKKKNKGGLTVSDKIDKIVTNRFLALPIFAVVMFIVYYVSITTVGGWATDWTNDSLFGEESWSIPTLLGNLLDKLNCADWLYGLIIDGIVGGVGAVLGFVPQMLVLFIFLGFLEACGYMARVAFVMDRIFRKFGLSGKSFIPMLIGTGCGIPGIMASRTIENERDRRMTITTTTFIPCGAKLPIIGLIAGALFDNSGLIAASAYFVGIAAIIISGIMLKKTKIFAGDPAPFVMELPAYHLPTVGNVLRSMWERGWSFIKKAGTVILLSAIVLWFLQSFGWENGFGMVEDLDNSVLAKIGKGFAWIFAPLGWGEWKAAVATVTGLIAKENVVTTFGQLFHFAGEELSENGDEIWSEVSTYFTALSAYSFLVFNLLCAPCFAAMGAIKREMNSAKWTLFAIGYQCVFAYAVSLIIYQVGSIFTGNVNVFGLIVALILIAFIIYMLVRPYKESNKLTAKVRIKS